MRVMCAMLANGRVMGTPTDFGRRRWRFTQAKYPAHARHIGGTDWGRPGRDGKELLDDEEFSKIRRAQNGGSVL